MERVKPVLLINLGTRAGEVQEILSTYVFSTGRHAYGDAVVFFVSPASDPYCSPDLLKKAPSKRAQKLLKALEGFREYLDAMKGRGHVQEIVELNQLTLFGGEVVASHHIVSPRYLRKLLTEVLVRSIRISKESGKEVYLYIPLPGWPHSAYPVLESFDNFFGGGYRGVRVHRLDYISHKLRDPRNGRYKWVWEMDEESRKVHDELKRELGIVKYEHLVEIKWEEPWSYEWPPERPKVEIRGSTYAVVAAMHEEAGTEREIHYLDLFERIGKDERGFYCKIDEKLVSSLKELLKIVPERAQERALSRTVWNDMQGWLKKTRLLPVLGGVEEGIIKLSEVGAELCKWVYEIEEKIHFSSL
jgi:hypothetical protein